MKKRLIKIIVLLLFIAFAVGLNNGLRLSNSTVRAVGDLSVNWGVPEGDPIFVINNFAPGQQEVRQVNIINNALTIRPVGVRGLKTSETGGLADKLLITVSEGVTDLYGAGGSKTLSEFFSESAGPEGIPLMNFNGGDDKNIDFKVTFNPEAGNDFQNTGVIFDIRIGIAVEVPAECLDLDFAADPIFGTQGPDNIRGTNGNDLIYSFEGDDKVESSNGNDCVIGGAGNDNINNSNGNDVLYGNDGDDILKGSNGQDKIFGGIGKDKIYASNGDDLVEGGDGDDYIDGSNGEDILNGGAGNDQIKGSNGDDLIHGGVGDDILEGGNGADQVFGDENNDKLLGGNGNDFLDGGEGSDTTAGNLGSDTCLAEVKSSCEL